MICAHCGDPDATESIPYVGSEDQGVLWYHNECQLRNVLGGLKHSRRECSCFVEGGNNDPPFGMTQHDEALEIARLVQAGEWNYG